MIRPAALLCTCVVACGPGSSAGGGGRGPAIQSFTASRSSIQAGAQVQLTAVFQNGAGSVDQGVGAVQSGAAVTVSPATTTTYVLTVAGDGGPAASTSATVLVGQGTACIGKPLLDSLGKTALLAGASMSDATASGASWDSRYLYLAGGLFDGGAPCASCASGCVAAGHSCANSAGGCAWWGCWQYDQVAPGAYARDFVAGAKGRGQVPWFTYYELLQASGLPEGTAQVAALNDAAFLGRYLGDFRFLLQQIGNDAAFVHVEPDFWAFAQQLNSDPHAIPAKVREAAPADCGTQEESLAGFGRCLVAMARKYAPNARIGLHASGWATGVDVALNRNASLDVAGEARKLASFLSAAGATMGDFVVTDASDRDAGYYASIGRQTWWDATNQTLPHFHQELAWVKALAEALQLPVFFWQVPVGNSSLNDTSTHWKDNRVEYFYGHGAELAAAHVTGMLFGAGAGGMTTPETDGGLLLGSQKAYVAAGGQPLCQ